MPPDPLSYNMSDVNPHLTRCEPPPYIKAGSAHDFTLNSVEVGLSSSHGNVQDLPRVFPNVASGVEMYLKPHRDH